jgi:hypothetical protein
VKDVAARLAELETIQNMMDDDYLRGDLLLLAIVILDSLHRSNKLNTKLIHARTGWDIYNIKRIVEKESTIRLML